MMREKWQSITRTNLGWLLTTGLTLALAGPAGAQDVTHRTRVDEGDQVFVDVENDSGQDIVVSSAFVAFYDKQGTLLEKGAIDCDQDCLVRMDDSESFGPIDGPKGWDTVKITKVYYDSAQKAPVAAPRPPASPDGPKAASAPTVASVAPKPPVAPPPPVPPAAVAPAVPVARPASPASAPTAAPTAPGTTTGDGTPLGALKLFYSALSKGEYDKARGYNTDSAKDVILILGKTGYRDWATQETRNGVIVDILLTRPVDEKIFPTAYYDLTYADGSKASRWADLAKYGSSWKVGMIHEEPPPQ